MSAEEMLVPQDNFPQAYVALVQNSLSNIPRKVGDPFSAIADVMHSLAEGISDNLAKLTADSGAHFARVKQAQVDLEKWVITLEKRS